MNKKKAKDLFRKFWGLNPKKEKIINLDDMSNLTFLGIVDKIDYIAFKPKFGDKDDTIYSHTFKKNPMLLTNGKDLILYGKIKITDKGIEG